ncbi:dTMP kinase [Chitinolyticbacter albus]|uniref:dTMP kinase n=1 Tax=Chitinolyticbacter albus TaxID=2961951 RepID=UPI00210BE939|nr:hypothetical protein [Chitinolyticbacter albus]
MLINILGSDGGGKTTQIAQLIQWTQQTFGLPARSLVKRDLFDAGRFPESAFFGCDYETLAHRLLPQMPAEGRALWLFYMNAVLIRGAPPQGREVVFLDGYWHKHFATEAALGLDTQWLLDVCRCFPEPDLTLLLDIDPRVTVARGHVHKPYESGCDFECSDASFIRQQDAVRRHLLQLAQSRGYPVLDAERGVDEVFDTLCEHIAPLLELLAA